MNRRRGLLAIAFAVGLAARLAFALGYWVDKPTTLDEREYLTLGTNLAAGRGLVYDDDGREHFGRAPGYPAFLAAIFALGGGTRSYKVAQSIVGALGVLLVADLARRAAGARAALPAALLAALYPPLVWICGYALSEPLYSTLALACAALLGRALERDAEASPWLVSGLVGGLSALVRPAALPFLALVVGYLALRRSFAGAALFAAGAAIVIAPWAAHKSREAGRLVLIASEGGITFWTGNHPLAIGEGDMAANPAIREANQRLRAAHPGLGADALEAVYYDEAKRFIRERPLDWLALVARKLFYLWVPIGPSYTLHSTRYYAATLASYLTLLPLALYGWWAIARGGGTQAPLWLLAASVVLTCLVFSPQERFRIPVLDPTMIVGAAAAWALRRGRGAAAA